MDYLIDPSFHGVNRLFVLSFESNAFRTLHTRYFILIVEKKVYNDLMTEKSLYEEPVKNDMRKYDDIF